MDGVGWCCLRCRVSSWLHSLPFFNLQMRLGRRLAALQLQLQRHRTITPHASPSPSPSTSSTASTASYSSSYTAYTAAYSACLPSPRGFLSPSKINNNYHNCITAAAMIQTSLRHHQTSSTTPSTPSTTSSTSTDSTPTKESNKRVREYINQASSLSSTIASIQSTITHQRDWSAIRQELESLKSKLNNTTNNEEEDVDANSSTSSSTSNTTKNDENTSIWEQNPEEAIRMQKRLYDLEKMYSEYHSFTTRIQEGISMLELAKEEHALSLSVQTEASIAQHQNTTSNTKAGEKKDILTEKEQEEEEEGELFVKEILADFVQLKEDLEKYSFRMMMSKPNDKSGCFVEIRAGAGGIEACDFTSILSRMYEKWGTWQNHDVSIVDEMKGEVAGYKSITLHIQGEYAYGWCKYETGVHRFVRISKYGENKRQTSFASVQVFPSDIQDSSSSSSSNQAMKDIDIPAGDIRIDVMRAQGAGGQHVNKTESAVRITHLPSGIVVACQNGRSQHQNKATAMMMLRGRLHQRKVLEKAQSKADAHATLPENAWGSQIRSYVVHPYQLIKDLRTGYERSDVDRVLDGDLDGFMEASLLHFESMESAS